MPVIVQLSSLPVSLLETEKPSTRRFVGVANSGKPFLLNDKATVLDLSDVQLKPQTAVLLQHDPMCRAGVAALSVTDEGLVASGTLLNNEYGNQIAQEADASFPWEMSVYANAVSVDEYDENSLVEVNGHLINGPINVLRQITVREISFTPVGIDAATYAVVLSDNTANQNKSTAHPPINQPKETPMTEDEKNSLKR